MSPRQTCKRSSPSRRLNNCHVWTAASHESVPPSTMKMTKKTILIPTLLVGHRVVLCGSSVIVEGPTSLLHRASNANSLGSTVTVTDRPVPGGGASTLFQTRLRWRRLREKNWRNPKSFETWRRSKLRRKCGRSTWIPTIICPGTRLLSVKVRRCMSLYCCIASCLQAMKVNELWVIALQDFSTRSPDSLRRSLSDESRRISFIDFPLDLSFSMGPEVRKLGKSMLPPYPPSITRRHAYAISPFLHRNPPKAYSVTSASLRPGHSASLSSLSLDTRIRLSYRSFCSC